MLLKSTYCYNVFLDDAGQPFIESRALPVDEMLDDINDTNYAYVHTILIRNGVSAIQSFEEEAQLRLEAKDYLERLTGHEMGVASGKV